MAGNGGVGTGSRRCATTSSSLFWSALYPIPAVARDFSALIRRYDPRADGRLCHSAGMDFRIRPRGGVELVDTTTAPSGGNAGSGPSAGGSVPATPGMAETVSRVSV